MHAADTRSFILGRSKLVSHGAALTIGELTVRRGDFIVGDKDGVVVIPRQVAPEVLTRAEEVVNTESEIRKAILQGVHPVDAYREYGRF